MPSCAILNCSNNTNKKERNNGEISFHRFPNDPKFKEKWIEATGHKNWYPTKHSRICSVHFDYDCFRDTKNLRCLTTDAIPTIDVLKTSINEENIDQNNTPCNILIKREEEEETNSEKDGQEQSTSNENTILQTYKKERLIHKLNLAHQKIQQNTKLIKRLREQNRRKGIKILTLMALLNTFRKSIV